MKLDDFLKRIRKCPDDKLGEELGIGDNWVIFLKADFIRFIEDSASFGNTGIKDPDAFKWIKERSARGNYSIGVSFFYEGGLAASLNVRNWLESTLIDGWRIVTEEIKQEALKKLRLITGRDDYNLSLSLHPDILYMKERGIMDYNRWKRAVAMLIMDIGEYVKREKTCFCIPNFACRKCLGDYSGVIYWPEKVADETRKSQK